MYLNELDQFVKRTLKCRHYLRYVDDMVLLALDQATLVQWCLAVEVFLRERLKLELRPEMRTPFMLRRGFDFVGWKTWWNRRLPRRRTLGNMQSRLERFERVGGLKPLRVEVRIIAATNRDLDRAVKEERFREDLYHRLHVVPITLPSLRERKEDVPGLIDFFLHRFSLETKKRFTEVTEDARKKLLAYDWPGACASWPM